MRLVAQALHAGHKILACGNGGSAADAQHFVAEFIGRYMTERDGLPAISLTTDPSIITAVGNDYGFDVVFSRQLEALGQAGDVLIALSTSGRSPNIVRAIEAALARGIGVIALTGDHGDPALEKADVWCRVPSSTTPHIQEIHTALLHSICVGAEQLLGVGRP
jgi:D-sedoheptulose 7-phosphate isomerase